jgi:ribonuclease P protein component
MNAKCSLTSAEDFARVHQNSRWSGNGLVGIKSCLNGGEVTRFGLIVSKRVGGAVQRNLVKRRLREITRRLNTKQGMDILISARPGTARVGYEDLKNAVLISLKRANLLTNND